MHGSQGRHRNRLPSCKRILSNLKRLFQFLHLKRPKVRSVSVKTAGVTDDLIFVELASKKDPSATYRLVIDVDVEALQVKQATVSDAQGR